VVSCVLESRTDDDLMHTISDITKEESRNESIVYENNTENINPISAKSSPCIKK